MLCENPFDGKDFCLTEHAKVLYKLSRRASDVGNAIMLNTHLSCLLISLVHLMELICAADFN